jgi:hypothetical protein
MLLFSRSEGRGVAIFLGSLASGLAPLKKKLKFGLNNCLLQILSELGASILRNSPRPTANLTLLQCNSSQIRSNAAAGLEAVVIGLPITK